MGVIADILEAHEAGFLDGEETRQYVSDLAESLTRKTVAESILVADLAWPDGELCDECRTEAEAAQTDTLH